jgi:hypothetical protein
MKSLQSRDSRRVGQDAYTLPELLVATFVVGVFVVSLYAGFGSGFSLLRLVREDARATQIIQEKIETLRLCPWSQLPNFPTSFQENYNPLATTNDPFATTINGAISLTTPDIPAAYATNLRLVTITVWWTNCDCGKPVAHTNQAQTQLARYGMHTYQWGANP